MLKKSIELESNSVSGCTDSTRQLPEQTACNEALLNPQLALPDSIQKQHLHHLQQMNISLGSRLIELYKSANNLTFELQPAFQASDQLKKRLNDILADEANCKALHDLQVTNQRVPFNSSPIRQMNSDPEIQDEELASEPGTGSPDEPASQEDPASQNDPLSIPSKRQRKEPSFLNMERENAKENTKNSKNSKDSNQDSGKRSYIRSGKYVKGAASKLAIKAAGELPHVLAIQRAILSMSSCGQVTTLFRFQNLNPTGQDMKK